MLAKCESIIESIINSPDIEKKLDAAINFGNFSVKVYVPLVQKDSVINIHGHTWFM